MSKLIAKSAKPLLGTTNISMLREASSEKVSLFCDITKDMGPSASGKTTLVASSGGNKKLGNSNAFLGLNIYYKNAKAIDDATLKPLAQLAPINPALAGFEWQVLDKQYLHVQMDFSQAQKKPSASEKNITLFTTGGNKALGKTGLCVGINCYYAANAVFDVNGIDALATKPDPRATISVSDDTNYLFIHCDLAGLKDGEGIHLNNTPVPIDGFQATINFHIVLKGVSPQPPKSPKKASVKQEDLTFEELGANTWFYLNGSQLVVKLGLAEDSGLSGSGKSMLLANSGGFKPCGSPAVRLNVTVTKKSAPYLAKAVDEVLGEFKAKGNTSVTLKETIALVMERLGLETNEQTEATRGVVKDLIRKKASASNDAALESSAPDSPSPTKKRSRTEVETEDMIDEI